MATEAVANDADDDNPVELDFYNSDLNLVIDSPSYSAHPLTDEGFAFMWAGARATHGISKGKICFELELTKQLDVPHLPADEAWPHVVRVGFSTDGSSMQLGEEPLSYAYGSTGKMSTDGKFKKYGQTFGLGDVITAYLDMESNPVTIGFAKNGSFLGWAHKIEADELQGRALYPHVLTKNCSYEINFGQRDKTDFNTPDAFLDFPLIGTLQSAFLVRGPESPDKRQDCEVLMMFGLPGSGKSTWAAEHAAAHSEKRYNVLGTSSVIGRTKVMGFPRRRGYRDVGGWELFMKMTAGCVDKLLEIASKLCRNYIVDEANLDPSDQRTKMKEFWGFKRKVVVVIPEDEEYRVRFYKKERDNGREITDKALREMKANFVLPEVCDVFEEVIFVELQKDEALELVKAYNEEGKSGASAANKKLDIVEQLLPKRQYQPDGEFLPDQEKDSGSLQTKRSREMSAFEQSPDVDTEVSILEDESFEGLGAVSSGNFRNQVFIEDNNVGTSNIGNSCLNCFLQRTSQRGSFASGNRLDGRHSNHRRRYNRDGGGGGFSNFRQGKEFCTCTCDGGVRNRFNSGYHSKFHHRGNDGGRQRFNNNNWNNSSGHSGYHNSAGRFNDRAGQNSQNYYRPYEFGNCRRQSSFGQNGTCNRCSNILGGRNFTNRSDSYNRPRERSYRCQSNNFKSGTNFGGGAGYCSYGSGNFSQCGRFRHNDGGGRWSNSNTFGSSSYRSYGTSRSTSGVCNKTNPWWSEDYGKDLSNGKNCGNFSFGQQNNRCQIQNRGDFNAFSAQSNTYYGTSSQNFSRNGNRQDFLCGSVGADRGNSSFKRNGFPESNGSLWGCRSAQYPSHQNSSTSVSQPEHQSQAEYANTIMSPWAMQQTPSAHWYNTLAQIMHQSGSSTATGSQWPASSEPPNTEESSPTSQWVSTAAAAVSDQPLSTVTALVQWTPQPLPPPSLPSLQPSHNNYSSVARQPGLQYRSVAASLSSWGSATSDYTSSATPFVSQPLQTSSASQLSAASSQQPINRPNSSALLPLHSKASSQAKMTRGCNQKEWFVPPLYYV